MVVPTKLADPVEGGSANDYDYAYGDPENHFDLDGRCAFGPSAYKRGIKKGTRGLALCWEMSKRFYKRHGALYLSGCAVGCITMGGGGMSLGAANLGKSGKFRAGTGVAAYGTLGTKKPSDSSWSLMICAYGGCAGGYWNSDDRGWGAMAGVGSPGVFAGFSWGVL